MKNSRLEFLISLLKKYPDLISSKYYGLAQDLNTLVEEVYRDGYTHGKLDAEDQWWQDQDKDFAWIDEWDQAACQDLLEYFGTIEREEDPPEIYGDVPNIQDLDEYDRHIPGLPIDRKKDDKRKKD